MRTERSLKIGALWVGSLLLANCSKLTTSETRGITRSVEISTFQGALQLNWISDDEGRIWTNSRELHITGECLRGIYSVQMKIKGTSEIIGKPALCGMDQKFDWTGIVTREGAFTLELWPTERDLTMNGLATEFLVGVDTTPPAAPVITTNHGANFIVSSGSVVIEGTVEAEVSHISLEGGGRIRFEPNSGVWSHVVELNPGQTSTFTYRATNRVGAESETVRITVAYMPSAILKVTVFSGVRAPASAPVVASGGQVVLRQISLTPFQGAPLGIVRTVVGGGP